MSIPNQKPGIGAILDHTHPLARGLKYVALMNVQGGLIEDLAGGQNATVSGTPVWSPDENGIVADFDGTHYYESSIEAGVLADEFTIICRIKMPLADSAWDCICANKDATGGGGIDGWSFQQYSTQSDRLGWQFQNNTTYVSPIGPSSMTPGWHIAAVRRVGNVLEQWIDGKYYNEYAFTLDMSNPDREFRVGADNPNTPGSEQYIIARVDYLYIYDRALANKEIESFELYKFSMFSYDSEPEITKIFIPNTDTSPSPIGMVEIDEF